MLGKVLVIGTMVGVLGISGYVINGLSTVIKPAKFPSTIRLHTADGRFFCSGAVINDTTAITAAHCIVDNFGFFMALSRKPIAIYTANGVNSYVVALPKAASPAADVGIIYGDFRNFEKQPIQKNANKIHEAFTLGAKACGFPWGGKLTCFSVSKLGKYFFHYTSTDGGLWPGMSGGPVVDNNGLLIGVNSAVSEKENIYAPIVEIDAMLGEEL